MEVKDPRDNTVTTRKQYRASWINYAAVIGRTFEEANNKDRWCEIAPEIYAAIRLAAANHNLPEE